MSISDSGRNSAPMRLSMAVAALAVCGTAFAGAAAAEPQGEALSRTVGYADLDLAQQVGAATLYRRLRAAAATVCGPFEGRAVNQMIRHRTCMEQAIARAVAEVDAPMLTALHRGETGAPGTAVRLAKCR